MIQLSEHFTYKKLLKFTLPSIAMMVFISLYNVIDGLFVSNFVGETAFSAVNLIMPVLMILGTVGFMFGTGGTAMVTKVYGQGDTKKANNYFSMFVYTAIIISIILAVLGIVFIEDIARFLGASGALLNDSKTYAAIILCALPFFVFNIMFQSFFIAAEKPKLGLLSTSLSGVTNIVLDAILVILLPFELKLAGAAIATAIAHIVGSIIPLIYFSRTNSSYLKLGKVKFELIPILKACANGSSEFMTQVSASIVGILFNFQLLQYAGVNGLAAYGVMMYVNFVFSSTFIGYSIGSAPLIAYNDGAKNYKELKNLLNKSLKIISTLGILMLIISQLLAPVLSNIFVGYNKELYDLTLNGFRIFSLSFLLMGFSIFTSGFFTALNNGLISAIISFLRTLFFQVLAIILLPLILGVNGIWFSVGFAEIMSLCLGIIFLLMFRKKYKY